jgi:hypothetical protein
VRTAARNDDRLSFVGTPAAKREREGDHPQSIAAHERKVPNQPVRINARHPGNVRVADKSGLIVQGQLKMLPGRASLGAAAKHFPRRSAGEQKGSRLV